MDNEPQPNYCGDEFYQADALEYIEQRWKDFDAIHASPPCQLYTGMRNITISRYGKCLTNYPDLIEPTRRALLKVKLPWLIENVKNSPLITQIILCGASLGLMNVSRHRHFESNYLFFAQPCTCRHQLYTIGVYGSRPDGRRTNSVGCRPHRVARSLKEAQELMQIDWMNWEEIKNAIPPIYTEYLGKQLMFILKGVSSHPILI